MTTENRPYLDLPAPKEPPKPRQAASLIVLRDSPRGMEVLMIRRAVRPGDQNSGATVLPGGLLDASDRGHYERCNGLDDATAGTLTGLVDSVAAGAVTIRSAPGRPLTTTTR